MRKQKKVHFFKDYFKKSNKTVIASMITVLKYFAEKKHKQLQKEYRLRGIDDNDNNSVFTSF